MARSGETLPGYSKNITQDTEYYGIMLEQINICVYNKLHKTQRQPSAFKPYGCWGRASRSAPAYPGKSAILCLRNKEWLQTKQ
jgi:hypothetical protein